MVEHATVSVTAVISIVAAIFSLMMGILGVLLKFSVDTYQAGVNKRIGDLESEMKEKDRENKVFEKKNHELEKELLRTEGRLALIESNVSRNDDDVHSINETMVKRDEWEPRMKTVEETLQTILREVQRPAGTRYASVMTSPSGQMSAVRGASEPPKGTKRT